MKAALYDYRVPVNGRPVQTTLEIPPDLEFSFDVFLRNDWAIGKFRKPGQVAPAFAVGVFDVMTDLILASVDVASEDDAEAAVRRLCAIDPPILTAAFNAGVTEKRGDPVLPETPDTTEEV